MQKNELENGFYWISGSDDTNEPEVAELVNGEWSLVGTNEVIKALDGTITVLSSKLEPPNVDD